MLTRNKDSVVGNIWKLYVLQALTQALFFIPIVVLFFQSFGLSLRDIFILQAAFSFAVLAFEIPTGYFADNWGRKITIIIGCSLALASFIVYGCSTGFWSILLAEVIMGLGVSFISGTMEAMTYDTLLQMGEQSKSRTIARRQNFLEFSTEAVCGFIGGLLATISLVLPIWVTAIPFVIAIFIASTLVEPSRKMLSGHCHWKKVWDVSVHTLFRHKGLRSIILVHALLSSMTLTMFWFTQPYQKMISLPVGAYGAVHCCIVLAGAISALLVAYLEKRLDDRKILMTIAGSVIACYVLLCLPPGYWGLVLFLIGRCVWGMMGPLTTDIINRMTTSDVRATVISMRSFLGRFIFVLVSPFIGGAADAWGLQSAFLLYGLVGGLVLFVAFLRIRSVWKDIPS